MSADLSRWLQPDWPAPKQVRAVTTTRISGYSQGVYAGFNLGTHVGDAPSAVAQNRACLADDLDVSIHWLNQVHGTTVVEARCASSEPPADADAVWTRDPGVACAIMTADCLPVLMCDRAGTVVAAAHAGWRGLADGVVLETLRHLRVPAAEVLVWLGPAIGPSAFEVGDEVRARFCEQLPEHAQAFVPGVHPGKWWCDLFLLARQQLRAASITQVYGGGVCTHSDAARFYSYRRDGVTGRFASLVWLADADAA